MTTTHSPIQGCLDAVANVRPEKFTDQEKLLSAMLGLCRPEIESAARDAFLHDKAPSLENAREAALASAMAYARNLLGSVEAEARNGIAR